MKKILLVLASLWIVLLAAASVPALHWLRDNRKPNFSRSGELYVWPGDDAETVFEAICRDFLPKDTASLLRSFKKKKVPSYLKPGHYTISENNTSVYVCRMLNNGWQTPVRLTLSGNLRIKSNIAAKIACQMLADSASICTALQDEQLLEKYGATPQTAFSLLLPDTYEILWTATPEEIISRQKEALDAFWTPENLAKAKNLGLTRQEVSTLASIVNAESRYVPELPKIAGVYLNRLKLGMPLQADPTVAFCFDYKPQRILKKHLETDSPYNTYKHPGLPPGPICVPTRESLGAVLNPDFGEDNGKCNLYFCANPDFSGTHLFAKTLSEHNANARAFHKALTLRQKQRKSE